VIALLRRHLFPLSLLAIVVANLLLSAWKILYAPLVNKDAILYLIAAEKIVASGLPAAVDIYNWPMFHILMAWLHQLSGLPLLASGQLIMTACFILLTLGFCRVVRDLGGDDRTVLFAFLVILCLPTVTDLRSSLVRDPGLLAFMLLALSQQLRFAANPSWRHCLCWAGYIFMAFLFRVEALALALLAPLAMLLVTGQPLARRLSLCLQLAALPVAASILGLALAHLLLPEGLAKIKVIVDLGFMVDGARNLAVDFSQRAAIIGHQVLAEFSAGDAGYAYLAALLAIVVVNLFSAVSLPYALPLIAAGRWRSPPSSGARVVLFYGLVVLAYLCLFTLIARFNLTRYCLQLAVLLLLALPFVFTRLWHKPSARTTLVRGLIGFLIFANAMDGLISQERRKAYIRDAALWAREAPAIGQDQLISNEPYIAYFSTKSTTDTVLRAINASRQPLLETVDTYWLASHLYAYRVRQGEQEQALRADIARADGTVLRHFPGRDNRSVVVFQIGKDVQRSALLLERPE